MEKPTICRYCGSPVVFTSNAEIYGREYGDGKCYLCRNCKAFVGGTSRNRYTTWNFSKCRVKRMEKTSTLLV